MRELDFGEVHSTVKMRISFPAVKGATDVELYEVELPRVPENSASAVKTCGKARQVYVKCIVLGGALRTPLFGTVNQPFGG